MVFIRCLAFCYTGDTDSYMVTTQYIIITFAAALFFGTILMAVAGRLRIPPLVFLLAGGILLGPNFIGPGLIRPAVLGDGFTVIIQLAVALVLFEGGLNLDPRGYRAVSVEIKRALTIGVVITWLGSAAVIRFVLGFPWTFCILSGSLIIVTGPTVIGPILKRIGAKKKIHDFLHWESVLIDPIGVFIALLCFEWVIGENALLQFGLRILVGSIVGIFSGLILTFVLKRKWIPEDGINFFVVACVMAIFTLSHILIPESGLISVTIAGFVLGYTGSPYIDRLRIYKSQLVDTMIGLLFMLLAANLDIRGYGHQYLWGIVVAVLMVMFVIRPLNIMAVMIGRSTFAPGERLFLSWVAPRGIVAASMASIFAFNIRADGGYYSANAGFLEAFTYTVIVATVILQGFSARLIGRFLGVLEPEKTGWLIIGAHPLGMRVADFIIDQGFGAILMDTNLRAVSQARKEGFRALFGNAIRANIDEFPELYGVGNVLAVTVNEDLNQLACQHWQRTLNHPRLFKWSSIHLKGTGEKDDDIDIGKTVWKSFNLPEIINTMSEPERNIFREIKVHASSIRYPERIIMCSYRDRLYPYVPQDAQGDVLCLIARSPEMVLDLNTRPSWIQLSSRNRMEDVLRDLLDIFKVDYSFLDTGEILRRLLLMETEFPSAMGQGVAVPHTYLEGLSDSVVLIAVSHDGLVPVQGDDPVRIVFLVLSPADNPNKHIEILSQISRFVINDDNRKQLFDAKSREEIVELFFPELTAGSS